MRFPFGIEHRVGTDIDLGGPIGPDGQPMAIVPGPVEERGYHRGGQFNRYPLDPVECPTHRQAVEQTPSTLAQRDRKSVVEGKSASGRVDSGGRRSMKHKK